MSADRQVRMQKKQHVVIEGRELAISNVDKVFFPETGFTKGQVIAFYSEIADIILPHLRDRPLTLIRIPFERQRPIAQMRENDVRNFRIKSDDLSLGKSGLRKEDFVDIRDGQLPPFNYDVLLFLHSNLPVRRHVQPQTS